MFFSFSIYFNVIVPNHWKQIHALEHQSRNQNVVKNINEIEHKKVWRMLCFPRLQPLIFHSLLFDMNIYAFIRWKPSWVGKSLNKEKNLLNKILYFYNVHTFCKRLESAHGSWVKRFFSLHIEIYYKIGKPNICSLLILNFFLDEKTFSFSSFRF